MTRCSDQSQGRVWDAQSEPNGRIDRRDQQWKSMRGCFGQSVACFFVGGRSNNMQEQRSLGIASGMKSVKKELFICGYQVATRHLVGSPCSGLPLSHHHHRHARRSHRGGSSHLVVLIPPSFIYVYTRTFAGLRLVTSISSLAG